MISWYSFCHFFFFSSLRRLFPWAGLGFPLPRSPKTRNKRSCRQQVSHVSFLFPSSISKRMSKGHCGRGCWGVTQTCFLFFLGLQSWLHFQPLLQLGGCATRLGPVQHEWQWFAPFPTWGSPYLLPLQVVRWQWLLGQLWELPNENDEPQDGKGLGP